MSDSGNKQTGTTVVVGVDGSAGGKAALQWSLDEARLRKTPLRIVHAWAYGYMGATAGGYGYVGGLGSYTAVSSDVADLQGAAERLLDQMIEEAVGEAEDVEIERRVVDGHAAAVLIAAVVPGDLLVVGSRGHGGFAGMLLGSVSQQCVHHAPCPVVVVRPATAITGD